MTKNEDTGWKSMSNSERAAIALLVVAFLVSILMLFRGYDVLTTLPAFVLLVTCAARLYGFELGQGTGSIITAAGLVLAFFAFLIALSASMDRFKLAADAFGAVHSQQATRAGSRKVDAAKISAEDAVLRACATYGTDLNNAAMRAGIEARLDVPWSVAFAEMTKPNRPDQCMDARQKLLEIDPKYPFELKG